MKRRFLIGSMPVAFAAVALTGCTRPIYNVSRRPFQHPGSFEHRAIQIQRAAAGLGWQTDVVRPGVIRATLNLRTHVAVVEITYNQEVFSIIYADSSNLNYDGTNIHKNYNGWIENLERVISQQPSV
ncbi:hypothetical protein J5Y09_15365 [Roseomonas sp. PWR1]|uniref:Lipoprotein n=1 Tax=Roseomonas nitratireducens TaxID=2820810 RepID=A0ABS4AVA9_9PROT|nr:hypothetical protein [Neoroseomonas nitratireducens]MBP0465303.1 hypothetical protein [Neoroseomonas nitratireducens]